MAVFDQKSRPKGAKKIGGDFFSFRKNQNKNTGYRTDHSHGVFAIVSGTVRRHTDVCKIGFGEQNLMIFSAKKWILLVFWQFEELE